MIVTNVGWDAVDAGSADNERHESVGRSRVVLTPRCWRQVGGFIRKRRWQESRSPGRARYKVRRGKARFLRGCKSLPARVVPAGSNRSSREGNDPAEASGGEGHQVTWRVCGL